MWALWVLTVFLLLSISSAFEVSPGNPNPGDTITLKGSSSPNETVRLRSSFSMNLPVSAGQYEYVTKVTIPQTPNRITISARNVKDFNAGIKLGIWITKSFSASSGTVSLSQSNVPAGSYNLKIFGEALPGSMAVPVSVKAETQVKADSRGLYSLDIDTSGIPASEYRIEASGEAKTIQLGAELAPSRDRLAETTKPFQSTSEAKVEITPQVVRWYANKTDLKIDNVSQFGIAKVMLQERLEYGYWKVIRRGEPLTEEAGNCLQDYCLVRGTGACTSCREKDILLKGGQPDSDLRASESLASDNQSLSQAKGEEEGLWSKVRKWLGSFIGGGGVP